MTIYRQSQQLYEIPFRNLSSATMPAFGVGLISGSNVEEGGLFIPAVEESTGGSVAGMLVNGPREVPSGEYGAGYWGVGPMLALYDTADGAPAIGETWGIQSGSGASAFKLRKGYMGFTVVSAATAGSGDDARMFVVPSWHETPPIVGYLRGAAITITNADSDIRVVPLDQGGGNMTRGVWPSWVMPKTLDIDTGAHCFTVRRAGFWQIDASWTSFGSPRFSSPFQSKVHRVDIGVYVNGSRSGISGGISHYYHASLANADTSPTGGFAVHVPAAIHTGLYLAAGDVVDMRAVVSEVTADSGTSSEGHLFFSDFDFLMRFVGPQEWRNDY